MEGSKVSYYIGWLSLKLGMKQKGQSLFGSYWVWGSLSPWLLSITRSKPNGLGPCFPPHYLWLVIIQWVLSLLWLKIIIFFLSTNEKKWDCSQSSPPLSGTLFNLQPQRTWETEPTCLGGRWRVPFFLPMLPVRSQQQLEPSCRQLD